MRDDMAIGPAERQEMPMTVALFALSVARNTRLTGTDINIFAHFASHADESGTINVSTNPLDVAENLGFGRATVFRSFKRLHEFGIIDWKRARGSECAKGITGRIRIIVPADSV
jgi:CRP-like cAMP-binding protein